MEPRRRRAGADLQRRRVAAPSGAPPRRPTTRRRRNTGRLCSMRFSTSPTRCARSTATRRRCARRPKPPALAQQSLDLVERAVPGRRRRLCWRCSTPSARCSKRASAWCRRRPRAMPIPRRCSRRWAAAGGTAALAAAAAPRPFQATEPLRRRPLNSRTQRRRRTSAHAPNPIDRDIAGKEPMATEAPSACSSCSGCRVADRGVGAVQVPADQAADRQHPEAAAAGVTTIRRRRWSGSRSSTRSVRWSRCAASTWPARSPAWCARSASHRARMSRPARCWYSSTPMPTGAARIAAGGRRAGGHGARRDQEQLAAKAVSQAKIDSDTADLTGKRALVAATNGAGREKDDPRAVCGPARHHHREPGPVPESGRYDRHPADPRSDPRRFQTAAK